MRIGVLRTQVPFVQGGAEVHAANLVSALNAYGHEATEITLPFKWYPGEVLADHILAARMHDISESEGVPVDLAIGLKFPAWLVNHPNKLFWIIHQHRAAYDRWSAGDADLLHDADGEALRQLIHAEDRAAFASSAYPLYANSRNVAKRLRQYLDLEATPLYHPPPNADRLWQAAYGDYLFAPGRINPSKRIDLILRALAAARSRIRLVIAGVAENPRYQQELNALANELGVATQVTWLGRVDDATLMRHYAEARAVVFVPQDEDYGYITLEAMLAARPVITVSDAGGPLEFVTDRTEGRITAPKPADLGQAFEELMADATLAERMGQAGLARITDMQISWEHVVETLAGRSDQAIHPIPLPDAADRDITAASKISVRPTPELSPQDLAVEALKAAIAPPSPPDCLPFASIDELLAAYAFDELQGLLREDSPPMDDGLASYLGTHWKRYMTSLRALDGLKVDTALDVGVFPPLVFQALLANCFPGVKMSGLWEGPDPYVQTVRALRERDLPSFDITLSAANSERDPWPYPDHSFDLVTSMEILEHLALDPYFFFCEAARVLKPGGHMLLTTPNVVSHRGVTKVLEGSAPYSFGIFVPSGGVYGRHNREYAPRELPELGLAAGFQTVSLRTIDVYDSKVDPCTAELLAARRDDLTLRGETIFYLARKTEKPTGLPKRFYHGDPSRMAGELTLLSVEGPTGLAGIAVHNRSSQWWAVSGDQATCILAEWIDPDGTLRHQHLIQPITAPIAPKSVGRIALRLDPAGATGLGSLRLHLYQSGVGTMTGLGRAPTLTLPCSFDAFLGVVRSTPQPGRAK